MPKRMIMYHKLISGITPLGFTWQTIDPFLFCVHHQDFYPKGNAELGPAASLQGRYLGQDFTVKDGWRMYHGERIPGFPAHPHRGFETVTIVLEGFVDHSDSHGAAGRYGEGDVQWMTAGSGLQHSEMFPLLHQDRGNTLELFQIWLNLPAAKKFCKPHFAMLWAENIPKFIHKDDKGLKTKVTVISGSLDQAVAPPPAPDSWAADPDNQVGIWLIEMDPEASWSLPPAPAGVKRAIYFYRGNSIQIAGVSLPPYHSAELMADQSPLITNGDQPSFLLLLQGQPINEPMVQHGPFVMNTQEEIRQAISDFRATQFGGWPWPHYDNVHLPDAGRFARYANGKQEYPGR